MTHIPVLQKEVIQYLDPKPNENFIDATIGQGGHTLAILQRNLPNGKALGIELDPDLYQKLRVRMAKMSNVPIRPSLRALGKYQMSKRLILVNDSYINLKNIVKKHNFKPVNGILFDLGMSSWHLEESKRGFSFQRNEPLDMRYDKNQKHLTAEDIINQWPEKEIEQILREYGEERFSGRIAKEIVEARRKNPIKSTFQLVELIKKSTPSWYQNKRIHFATKTFQALRIAVNHELETIKQGLGQALDVLEKEGRLVIISFHSLEDRIVKNSLKEKAKQGIIKIETKKPIKPSFQEIKTNKRSRSAKLRVAIRI